MSLANPNAALPQLPDVEQLSPAVTVIRGLNPGPFTLQGTNTYLVGTGKDRILIDTGDGVPGYKDLVESVLRESNIIITQVILTHRHHDHVNGVPQIKELNPAVTVWKLRTNRDDDPAHQIPFEFSSLSEGQCITVEGATVRVQCTPGHCDDHVCLYLNEDLALFSGDCCLGHGTAVFEKLGDYMRSLEKTVSKFPETQVVYPGHGQVLQNGLKVMQEYIKHRRAREDQIKGLLTEKGPLTSRGIVEVIYAAYDKRVLAAAEHSVLQHLEKLEEDGLVVKTETEATTLFALSEAKI